MSVKHQSSFGVHDREEISNVEVSVEFARLGFRQSSFFGPIRKLLHPELILFGEP